MTKKKKETPVYEVVSIIEKRHLCTWKESKGKKGYGTAKYKVLITDDDAHYKMVSCLNETDLAETAKMGFDNAAEGYVPYEYDDVGVEMFEDMVMFEYETNDTTILDAFERAIDTLIESDMAITPDLAEYFHLADGLRLTKKIPIWAREMRERTRIEDIAKCAARDSVRWHIGHPEDKFDDK